MAIDLDAIRRKVSQLSGQNRNSSIQMFKPKAPFNGRVRGLPWKNAPEGQPFIEKWFYYIGDSSILAPNQFGKPDPINELIRKLYSSGTAGDKELAKQLKPRMRAYIPIIDRADQEKGVQVFSFGKIIYQKLLNYYLDEEVGDILDPRTGYDIKIAISQAPGKQFADTEVEAARSTSKLSEDPEQVKKWLESVPNLDDMYKLKSTEEIERILNNWLNGPAQAEQDVTADSAQRGGGGGVHTDVLDKLVAEIKADEPVKAEKPAKAKAAVKKPALDDDMDAQPAKKTPTLDEAFAELEGDD